MSAAVPGLSEGGPWPRADVPAYPPVLFLPLYLPAPFTLCRLPACPPAFLPAAAEAAGREPSLHDIQLHPNPYSWSKTVHVLYIDSPAGTGFSYTPGEAAYHTDDDKTIRDLEVFVEGFFQQHAWLRQQPLYVAGGRATQGLCAEVVVSFA